MLKLECYIPITNWVHGQCTVSYRLRRKKWGSVTYSSRFEIEVIRCLSYLQVYLERGRFKFEQNSHWWLICAKSQTHVGHLNLLASKIIALSCPKHFLLSHTKSKTTCTKKNLQSFSVKIICFLKKLFNLVVHTSS